MFRIRRIHDDGDPDFAYRNFPLAETITGDEYYATLNRALEHVRDSEPTFLVVALGLDAAGTNAHAFLSTFLAEANDRA